MCAYASVSLQRAEAGIRTLELEWQAAWRGPGEEHCTVLTSELPCDSQLSSCHSRHGHPSSTAMLEDVRMGGSEKRVVFARVYVQSKIMCKFLTVQRNFYMQH